MVVLQLLIHVRDVQDEKEPGAAPCQEERDVLELLKDSSNDAEQLRSAWASLFGPKIECWVERPKVCMPSLGRC